MKRREIEWRLYVSRGPISGAIHWYDRGYTHVDVVDPATGWLWGAHSDAMRLRVDAVPVNYGLRLDPKGVLKIPSGFYPRPPGYDAGTWRRVTAFRLRVSELQCERFWEFTQQQSGCPYDTRGLLDTYVLGRDWRDPGCWYCSEEQRAACEHAFIGRRVLDGVDGVDPQAFAEFIHQMGALQHELSIPAMRLVI